ncbi:hypothetical protein [Demequina flava]|uniref:hypothetical protein n=1 Tax=Demequina flava TaxID=1095025 RepID=UPI000781FFFD|nr:hypothetical protein [Demequina flava]
MTEQNTPEQPRNVEDAKHDAVPAQFRLAPRFGRVVGTGVVLGLVIGVVIALVLPNTTAVGTFTVAMLIGAGCAILGGVLGGLAAVWLDRSTPKRLKESQRADASDSDD